MNHCTLIFLIWLSLNHLRGLWAVRQWNFSDSFMIPFLSSPEAYGGFFSRLQLQRGYLRSEKKTEPSLGVRLNKTLKSIGLHFSQGSLRRFRSSRATGPQSATCSGDLAWDSLTAGAENRRSQERCPFCDLQVGVYVSDLCYCSQFHYLDFMD